MNPFCSCMTSPSSHNRFHTCTAVMQYLFKEICQCHITNLKFWTEDLILDGLTFKLCEVMVCRYGSLQSCKAFLIIPLISSTPIPPQHCFPDPGMITGLCTWFMSVGLIMAGMPSGISTKLLVMCTALDNLHLSGSQMRHTTWKSSNNLIMTLPSCAGNSYIQYININTKSTSLEIVHAEVCSSRSWGLVSVVFYKTAYSQGRRCK